MIKAPIFVPPLALQELAFKKRSNVVKMLKGMSININGFWLYFEKPELLTIDSPVEDMYSQLMIKMVADKCSKCASCLDPCGREE